jgi:hypothetical protein
MFDCRERTGSERGAVEVTRLIHFRSHEDPLAKYLNLPAQNSDWSGGGSRALDE